MKMFIPLPPLRIHEDTCGCHSDMEAGMNQILTSSKGVEHDRDRYGNILRSLIRAEENDCWYDGRHVILLEAKR